MNVVDLLGPVVERVLSAGKLLSTEWHRIGGPRGRGDKAAIDSEIETQLRLDLLKILDCDFWGEETGTHMTGHEYCWVVDPNDGTGDFLQHRAGSAISVGLLHNAIPVLGVVYAPVTPDGGEDCISWAEGLPAIIRNRQTVHTRLDQLRLTSSSSVLVSTAATSKPELNSELCAPADFIPMPSIAYRLARTAAGDAVVGTSLVPVSAHDVVGGHALLIGAGGMLIDQDGEPITYESEERMKEVSLRCFGGAPEACRELLTRNWKRLFRQ
ncbi:inositol monophosphatase family protein [Pseudomonas sp. Marseille-Q0931]|uniref:inositol monophosphatase family protein n=1 Tax=Pseudomonas sp. Marseille-Q0931 TaxID=2697507 RepID=UPI0023B9F727|nr:inositol monophosphatase family protein [Pseudomonas sp. Marseille-Q0931]